MSGVIRRVPVVRGFQRTIFLVLHAADELTESAGSIAYTMTRWIYIMAQKSSHWPLQVKNMSSVSQGSVATRLCCSRIFSDFVKF